MPRKLQVDVTREMQHQLHLNAVCVRERPTLAAISYQLIRIRLLGSMATSYSSLSMLLSKSRFPAIRLSLESCDSYERGLVLWARIDPGHLHLNRSISGKIRLEALKLHLKLRSLITCIERRYGIEEIHELGEYIVVAQYCQ